MKEIFKQVKGYEGIYDVSNLGRVKSFLKWRGTNGRIRKVNQSHISDVCNGKRNHAGGYKWQYK